MDSKNRPTEKGESMKNEVAEIGNVLSPVTRQDVEALKAQRELLKEFVSSQLKEAQFKDDRADDFGDGDYGIIPGTKKKVLLKPGAEKLLQLFGLGARFKLVDKEVDRQANFAMFNYKCEVYSRRTGVVIAECDASANSQEVKYRERTVWRKEKAANGKEIRTSKKEETPIYDVTNTLQKMAQKRSMVGATILATAASDYFTQDVEKVASQSEAQEDPRDVTPESEEKAPNCCNHEMMISKYPNRETGNYDWYCLKCKSSKPRG